MDYFQQFGSLVGYLSSLYKGVPSLLGVPGFTRRIFRQPRCPSPCGTRLALLGSVKGQQAWKPKKTGRTQKQKQG